MVEQCQQISLGYTSFRYGLIFSLHLGSRRRCAVTTWPLILWLIVLQIILNLLMHLIYHFRPFCQA